MNETIRAMEESELRSAIDLFRRTGDMHEHRAELEAELDRRKRLRRGEEGA